MQLVPSAPDRGNIPQTLTQLTQTSARAIHKNGERVGERLLSGHFAARFLCFLDWFWGTERLAVYVVLTLTLVVLLSSSIINVNHYLHYPSFTDYARCLGILSEIRQYVNTSVLQAPRSYFESGGRGGGWLVTQNEGEVLKTPFSQQLFIISKKVVGKGWGETEAPQPAPPLRGPCPHNAVLCVNDILSVNFFSCNTRDQECLHNYSSTTHE